MLKRFVTGIVSLAIVALMNCGGDKGLSANEPVQPPFVGQWQSAIQAIAPFLPQTIIIQLDIREDTTHRLIAWYDKGDTALVHAGSWQTTANEDTITLKGNYCAILDTSTHILNQKALCPTITAPFSLTNDKWILFLKEFMPIAGDLGINMSDALILKAVESYQLEFTKVK